MSSELSVVSENSIADPNRGNELDQREEVISNALWDLQEAQKRNFYVIGHELAAIWERNLYKAQYASFDYYCETRWNFSSSYANKLIRAAEVVDNVSKIETVVLIPQTEYQARPLTRLSPEQQGIAWQRAVETAPDGNITRDHVKSVVQEMLGERPQEPIVSDSQPDKELSDSHRVEPDASLAKSYHAGNRTVGEQFHSKLMWNYHRIKWDVDMPRTFTIGYSQRSWQQFLELLEVAKVQVLIDVRKNPVSQYKPEFSKQALMVACKSSGIEYIHIPALGVDFEDRAELNQTHDYATLFDAYEQRLPVKSIVDLINQHVNLKERRIALMCVEIDPETCHRGRIASALETAGYSTLDL